MPCQDNLRWHRQRRRYRSGKNRYLLQHGAAMVASHRETARNLDMRVGGLLTHRCRPLGCGQGLVASTVVCCRAWRPVTSGADLEARDKGGRAARARRPSAARLRSLAQIRGLGRYALPQQMGLALRTLKKYGRETWHREPRSLLPFGACSSHGTNVHFNQTCSNVCLFRPP